MKVRDMVHGLRWGWAASCKATHIMHADRAECGARILYYDVPRKAAEDNEVCKRCLKVTEKYA